MAASLDEKSLIALYWTAFVLEIITLIPWTILAWSGGTTAFELMFTTNLTTFNYDATNFAIHLLMIFPLILTVTIFILHIQSYLQLKKQGFVSLAIIRWQSVVGVAIAITLSFVVFTLVNIGECFDACFHPANFWLTTALPIALVTLSSLSASYHYHTSSTVNSSPIQRPPGKYQVVLLNK